MHQHFYFTYCSYIFPRPRKRKDGTLKKRKKWCLGINKEEGTIRLGRKTKDTHSFAQFQTRQVEEASTPFPMPEHRTIRPPPPTTTTPRPTKVGEVVTGTVFPPTKTKQKVKDKNKNKHRKKGCTGPKGLFNLGCSDIDDVITDVTELRRKSSRRRSKGDRKRSRDSRRRRKDRKKDRKQNTDIEPFGLFTG